MLNENLFREMRLVTYVPFQKEISDDTIALALTANENLKTLGYTLKPQDILKLAGSESVMNIYDDVKSFAGEVKAEPMYPDFPSQVLSMDEAEFRFHQAVHYFSTYGLESMFGVSVKRGWMPTVERTEKVLDDTDLLDLKVLELIPEQDMYRIPAERILSKRQRVTLPEKEILAEALPNVAPAVLSGMKIPFKENLPQIFLLVFDMDNREAAMEILKAVCKHPGDVLKCIRVLLGKRAYHLKTSEKRFLVKLLESYPAGSFAENLIPSRKKREDSLVLLKFLDFNTYSRSPVHGRAVAQLRNKELHSWEGNARRKLAGKDEDALAFVAKRPGQMLRMLAWILRLGYNGEDVLNALLPYAGDLSTQTLVQTATAFGRDFADEEDTNKLLGLLLPLLMENLAAKETPLKGKKVYLEMGEFVPDMSEIQFNEASKDGGYIRSGLAYAIPEDVKIMRFFVYWNDEYRVDIDLHALAETGDNRTVRIGWCNDFNNSGIVFSGDITHSDAAEYIDVDLNKAKDIERVYLNIHSFTGQKFSEIDTCFTGMMAVNRLNKKVKLYNAANCFFSHELKNNCKSMQYAFLDLKSRCIVFCGKESSDYRTDFQTDEKMKISSFTLKHYTDILISAQNAVVVSDKEDADVILSVGKCCEENGLSLIDENYFAD